MSSGYSISLDNFLNDPIGSTVDPIAGVDSNAKPKFVGRDYSAYDFDVGNDPTARALLREGFGMARGLQQPYGGPAQTRLAGEGNPEQLAAARRRRNSQYAAAGLPDVGFDPGLAGQKVDTGGHLAGRGMGRSALERGMDGVQVKAMLGHGGLRKNEFDKAADRFRPGTSDYSRQKAESQERVDQYKKKREEEGR